MANWTSIQFKRLFGVNAFKGTLSPLSLFQDIAQLVAISFVLWLLVVILSLPLFATLNIDFNCVTFTIKIKVYLFLWFSFICFLFFFFNSKCFFLALAVILICYIIIQQISTMWPTDWLYCVLNPDNTHLGLHNIECWCDATDIPEFINSTTKKKELRFGIDLFTQCVSTWDKDTEKNFYIARFAVLYL